MSLGKPRGVHEAIVDWRCGPCGRTDRGTTFVAEGTSKFSARPCRPDKYVLREHSGEAGCVDRALVR